MTNLFDIQRNADSYELTGELTFDTVNTAEQTAQPLFSEQSLLKIDLSGVNNFDSAGLALLVLWLQQAQHNNAELSYINAPQKVIAMVTAANLDGILPVQ